jgi:hypothetical protein
MNEIKIVGEAKEFNLEKKNSLLGFDLVTKLKISTTATLNIKLNVTECNLTEIDLNQPIEITIKNVDEEVGK